MSRELASPPNTPARPVGDPSTDGCGGCVVLVLGAHSAELLDELLSDVAASKPWRENRAATIVWQVERATDGGAVGDVDGANDARAFLAAMAAGGFRELTDGTALEPGVRYFVSGSNRVWFEGKRARVALRSPNERRPIDRLLLTLAEGWGDRSVSFVALPPGDDGESGLRIIRAVGGVAHRRVPLPWPRVVPSSPETAQPAAVLPAALHAMGLPLLVCDGQLRVAFANLEAQLAFQLSPADVGSPLLAVSSRLPGGADLVRIARRVHTDEAIDELITRSDARTYRVRVSAAPGPRESGVTLAFTDVTQLEETQARAVAQRHQHAGIARLGEVALTTIEPLVLCEEALGVLFGNLPACSAGLIVQRAGPPGSFDVLASRSLGVNPLRTLDAMGDAAAMLDAAIERGCMVTQSGERTACVEPTVSPARSGPRSARARQMSSLGSGVACPIFGDGVVLGAIALYGRRPVLDDTERQHFAQAIANVLGGAIVRHRTRRRLAIELDVSRLLAGASDLQAVGRGLGPALLSALPIEAVEIWELRDAGRAEWVQLFPSVPGPARHSPADRVGSPTGVMYSSLDGGRGELLIPIEARDLPVCMLRLSGNGLRTPDGELSEGLKRIARMLADFLERLRTLELLCQSEASFRQKSAELEALYTSLPVGVSIHDANGKIRHVNRHLASLDAPAGAPEAWPTQRLYAEHVPTWIERVLKSGEPIHDVELFVNEDGVQARSWLCNFAPIRSAEGTLHGASAVVQDITPLKRIEASLREADQQKDDFLAMLGHELRNPMAAIRNATELLSQIQEPTPQLVRLQSIFDRQTLQTTQLIDGLLDVARVARGKVQLLRGPVQIVELVQQVVGDRRQQFKRRALDVRLPDADLWVSADRARMLQILDNLLSNALKFTRDGGRIGIEVKRLDERGAIVVEDDGVGIDAELLPQIFEPFRQGHDARARSQGLGLGLALVKGLVDLHGFVLAARSDGPGRGASFQIEFPLARPADALAPPSPPELRGLDLVLVEDNPDIAETLAELLTVAGHRVEHRGSAEEALELLKQRRPDVVVCDIGLPGMSGLELATQLRADRDLYDLKLVALTGFGDASTQSRIDAAGFDQHLTKPVHLDALRRCLARVAGSPAPAATT